MITVLKIPEGKLDDTPVQPVLEECSECGCNDFQGTESQGLIAEFEDGVLEVRQGDFIGLDDEGFTCAHCGASLDITDVETSYI